MMSVEFAPFICCPYIFHSTRRGAPPPRPSRMPRRAADLLRACTATAARSDLRLARRHHCTTLAVHGSHSTSPLNSADGRAKTRSAERINTAGLVVTEPAEQAPAPRRTSSRTTLMHGRRPAALPLGHASSADPSPTARALQSFACRRAIICPHDICLRSRPAPGGADALPDRERVPGLPGLHQEDRGSWPQAWRGEDRAAGALRPDADQPARHPP